MKIKNINGTAGKNCNCDSWLSHWEKFTKQEAYTCSVPGCRNSDLVGAHVQIEGDQSWYICPLCPSHNNKKGGEFEMSQFVKLVSANVSETCGKE
jgi:hypothetical protein